MASFTATLAAQLDWLIEEQEEFVRFTSPQGFKFEFNCLNSIIASVVSVIDQAPVVWTRHNEYIENNGLTLYVVRCDPWLNKGFVKGDTVAEAMEFAKVLLKYVAQRWDTDSNSKLPIL